MNTKRFISITVFVGLILLCVASNGSAQPVDFISYLDEQSVTLPPEV